MKKVAAKILNGKEAANQIYSELEKEIFELKKKLVEPGLAIVQLGSVPESSIYVNKKIEKAKSLGINALKVSLNDNVSLDHLAEKIVSLNNDRRFHGIIVQLPLPEHLDPVKVMELINPEKDVDGFSYVNQGRLFAGKPYFVPATAKGIMALLKSTKQKIAGKKAVVLGRSRTVGRPVAALLMKENATVTVCHSKTKDLEKETMQADILVSAAGKPGLIKAEMVKKGAIVIDVGITMQGKKLVGDVDFESVKNRASFISPVPGGVGPMTVASLMQNTVLAAKRSLHEEA